MHKHAEKAEEREASGLDNGLVLGIDEAGRELPTC